MAFLVWLVNISKAAVAATQLCSIPDCASLRSNFILIFYSEFGTTK